MNKIHAIFLAFLSIITIGPVYAEITINDNGFSDTRESYLVGENIVFETNSTKFYELSGIQAGEMINANITNSNPFVYAAEECGDLRFSIQNVTNDAIVKIPCEVTPELKLESSTYNQGAMLKITGNDIPPQKDVVTTIYHPDGSKFGIFKTKSTNQGEFQVLVEIHHTSIRGEYTATSVIENISISKNFQYNGEDDLTFSNDTNVIEESEAQTSEPEPTQSNTPGTSSSSTSSNSNTSTNDWNEFIEDLDAEDRINLIKAVLKYLLS